MEADSIEQGTLKHLFARELKVVKLGVDTELASFSRLDSNRPFRIAFTCKCSTARRLHRSIMNNNPLSRPTSRLNSKEEDANNNNN